MSSIQKGVVGSSAAILFIGICLFPALSVVASDPSPDLLRSIAGLGTTIWIGWAIQAAIALGTSQSRGRTQEAFVGTIVGTTACGFLGIIIALSLAERADAGHWVWLDQLAFSLAASSLIFVGICIALLAYFIYEWSRLDRIDPSE
jgi:hypothetical protein